MAIRPAGTFYAAEDYHQNYYKRCAVDYKRYRAGSGRQPFIDKMWKGEPPVEPHPEVEIGRGAGFKKPDDETLRATLSPLQYEVTQCGGT